MLVTVSEYFFTTPPERSQPTQLLCGACPAGGIQRRLPLNLRLQRLRFVGLFGCCRWSISYFKRVLSDPGFGASRQSPLGSRWESFKQRCRECSSVHRSFSRAYLCSSIHSKLERRSIGRWSFSGSNSLRSRGLVQARRNPALAIGLASEVARNCKA